MYPWGMETLHTHYSRLLGLDKNWLVESVDLHLDEKFVEIVLAHVSWAVVCPQCGKNCSIADHAPERTWRHLDTMQFETRLRSRTPRAQCEGCGVKTIRVPWADKNSRFTLMFEAFAVEVLQACSSIKKACELIGLHWHSAQAIVDRAVARGLERRELDEIKHLGIDEKSFHKGHNYISTLVDLDGHRVLEVVEGRDELSTDKLWKTVTTEQKEQVEAVAIDMWPAFKNSAEKHLPNAKIVHDRFHISKHLNEAVDKVRRMENKLLQSEGNRTLTGTKQLWLFNEDNLSQEKQLEFQPLKERDLKTSRAWAIKENFRWFWTYSYTGCAKKYFKQWYYWATHSRLQPIKKVAYMLHRHLENILTWFKHPISNGVTEGMNSRIQSIKSAARGFRNFKNYRTRIFFFCGKLAVFP